MRIRPKPKPRYVEPFISNKDAIVIRIVSDRYLASRGWKTISFNSGKRPVRPFHDEDRAAEEREAQDRALDALKGSGANSVRATY